MTPYYICYAILAVAVIVGMLFNRLRIAAIIAFIPMFVLIVSRGLVGTDSGVYVQAFDNIYYGGYLASSFEPGFSILVELLSQMFKNSFDLLIFLGGVTAVIMLIAGLRLEKSPILFLTIILPFFMIDMTINGLRFGLAFAIVALGAAGLARGKLQIFIVCGIIAASIQISSVLLSFGLWALIEARIRTFLGVAVGSLLTIQFLGDRFEGKIADNSDIIGIGGLSGAVPLLATLVIIIAIQFPYPKIARTRLALFVVVGMQAASFVIARYYYAGLRLQSLFFFLLYLFIATSVRRAAFDLSKDRLVNASLIATLVISSASRLKNFEDDIRGPSPFNPYFISRELAA